MNNTGRFSAAVNCKSESERDRVIREIISEMTLDEKIAQMSGNTTLIRQIIMMPRYNYFTWDSGENKRLGIPPIKFTDGPHGVAINHSTCFTVSMGRGATWDPELEKRVGYAMGVESRSQGANYFGGVCINALRHPANGRAQESFGEDPHHLGTMAAGMIEGLQKHVMACAKHFACNSIENSRFFVSVKIDERTLREIYLPHFKKCVDAGVASFMSAYNRLNGVYCGHSSRLLRDILKNDWQFDGFVISDFLTGIRDGKAAANAGCDIEMPITWRYGKKLKKLVLSGEVAEETINESVLRILRQKARFASVGNPAEYDARKVACREHAELALEVARKSMVLLKNENSALPLRRGEVKIIAVLGKLADKINLGDLGSSRVRPPYAITPLQGIRNRAGDSVKVVYESGQEPAAARKAAKEADAVIVVAGLSGRDEGEYIPLIPPVGIFDDRNIIPDKGTGEYKPIKEAYLKIGGDRKTLGLSSESENLIKAVAMENKRCIVVLEGGSAITMSSWINAAEAVLMAWYPGMEGGNAIADILFGDFNPCGKLPIVFPKSWDQCPLFDNKAREVTYDYYHGYRLFNKKGIEPLFPFGFGLSYTKYEYKNLRIDKKEIGKTGKIKIAVDVANTGQIAGEEIVQIYVGYNGSKVDRPVKDLKGFGKLALNPGETKTLSLEIKAEDLAYYNAATNSWEVEEIEYIVYAGPSSHQKVLLTAAFRVKGS